MLQVLHSLADCSCPSATINRNNFPDLLEVAAFFDAPIDPRQRAPRAPRRARRAAPGGSAAPVSSGMTPRPSMRTPVAGDEISPRMNQHVAVRQRDRTAPAAPVPSTSARRRARAPSTACRRRSIPTRCRSARRRGSRPGPRYGSTRSPARVHEARVRTETSAPSACVFITPSVSRSLVKWPARCP